MLRRHFRRVRAPTWTSRRPASSCGGVTWYRGTPRPGWTAKATRRGVSSAPYLTRARGVTVVDAPRLPVVPARPPLTARQDALEPFPEIPVKIKITLRFRLSLRNSPGNRPDPVHRAACASGSPRGCSSQAAEGMSSVARGRSIGTRWMTCQGKRRCATSWYKTGHLWRL